VQSPDLALPEPAGWKIATQKAPSGEQLELLAFAWHGVKHVKSNAIVLAAKDGDALVTVGIGGGQTNRIDAVRQACERAGARAKGAVMASDAFFPFADGLEAAAPAGIVAVAQPGGALRDDEVIAAADRLGLALVLTGRRHFRH
jgi:phosphoribosylaminoimidazolecarboxamide formyltransferase/IMP cyclohydrolase